MRLAAILLTLASLTASAQTVVTGTSTPASSSASPNMPADITEQSYYPLVNGSLKDAGPNGYDGTPGPGAQAPLASAAGLSFTQAADQYATISCAAFNGAGTFIALVQPGDITTDVALPMVWGSDTATGLGFLPSNMGAPSWLSAGAANNLQAIQRPSGVFSVAVSPSTGKLWINGVLSQGYTSNIASVPQCNRAAYIGNGSTDGATMNFPFDGTILSLMKITTSTPTADQLAQILAYMWSQKAASGVQPVDANAYSGPVTMFVGDSRAACAGVANIVSNVSANCWTFYSQQAAGIGGATLASVRGEAISPTVLSNFEATLPQVDKFAGAKLAVWEGGGIDLGTGGTSAQVLANIDQAATLAHAHGMKFIASSIAPSVTNTDPMRSEVNAALLARARDGAYDGFIGFATMPWENQPQSTQCFLDGFHEVKFCQYQMSAYAACSLAFTAGANQCILPVIIPYLAWKQVNGTTATINLYDILPGQRVAAAYYTVVDPLAAPGCTAMVTSLGDSNGSPDSYLAPQSYPDTPSAINMADTFASNNGTVTATVTSVGCNLNAFTAGQLGVELLLVKGQ